MVRLKKLPYGNHSCNNLENYRGLGFGTLSQGLVDRGHPQDIVVFLTALSPRLDPHGEAKSSLDKFSHPAKIQTDLPALD